MVLVLLMVVLAVVVAQMEMKLEVQETHLQQTRPKVITEAQLHQAQEEALALVVVEQMQ